MIGAKQDLNSIEKQFISIQELLDLFSEIENITAQESAQWFINNVYILRCSKKLVLENSYTLSEYEHNNQNYYNCPIKTIDLIASGEDCSIYSDCIGFPRMAMLLDLKKLGANIDDKLIENSCWYISKNCSENDDNFYKNQCAHLIEIYSEKPKNLQFNKDDINYYQYIDSTHLNYVPMFALLLRVHHDLNFIGRYENEKTKQNRIKMCIEEYGYIYGCNPTGAVVDYLANLIKVRTASKQIARDAMSKIIIQD